MKKIQLGGAPVIDEERPQEPVVKAAIQQDKKPETSADFNPLDSSPDLASLRIASIGGRNKAKEEIEAPEPEMPKKSHTNPHESSPDLASLRLAIPAAEEAQEIPPLQVPEAAEEKLAEEIVEAKDAEEVPALAVPKAEKPKLQLATKSNYSKEVMLPCSSCSEEMAESAVLCTNCGFHKESGQNVNDVKVKTRGSATGLYIAIAGVVVAAACAGYYFLVMK